MIADLFTWEALRLLLAFAFGVFTWWLLSWVTRELQRRTIRAARNLLRVLDSERSTFVDYRRARDRMAHTLAELDGKTPPPARHSTGKVKR